MLSFFVATFSTKTLDVENTHSKEPLNMIHICWTNLILLAVTKLEIAIAVADAEEVEGEYGEKPEGEYGEKP